MRRNRASGFTLIELLLAMGLFAILSTGLIALLARSSDFLASGAAQTETMDSLQSFAETFSSDIATLASRNDSETGWPDVRLHCDWVPCDTDGDKKPDLTIQRLIFVRVMSDDLSNPHNRSAGTKLGAKEYLDQTDDELNSVEGKLRPTGGLQEVIWTTLPETTTRIDITADPAVMQIWRGYRSPPGGPKSLLPTKWHRDPNAKAGERGPMDAPDIRGVAKPMLSGVLYLGVDFWSRKTTTWDSQVKPKDGGPLPTWDSTRGILPQGEDKDGFQFSKRRGMAEDPTIDDPTDDTFPRRIRVTCVVEELGNNARVGYLSDDLSSDGRAMRLEDTRFYPATDTAQRFVKVENEWIEVETASGRDIRIKRRGARGTTAVGHKAGTKVHHGRTFVNEYEVAAFRDTYRDELPSITTRGGLDRRPPR